MKERKYQIQILGRGEDMLYSDSNLEIYLETTYLNGQRLYCSNTVEGSGKLAISFLKRREIIENLCEYFKTTSEPTIFVLDIADKDREEFEHFFENLISIGHKITVEYDSAKKREEAEDKMFISTLNAGKKLYINDVEIKSVEDYWGWKTKQKQ